MNVIWRRTVGAERRDTMRINKAVLLVIAIPLLLLGVLSCAPIVKEYAGPELPGNQTALVEAGAYTHLAGLDGKAVTALRLAVMPGVHSVTIKPAENEQPMGPYLYYSWVQGDVQFTAEAGHRYLVYVEYRTQPPSEDELGTGFVWIGHVVDRTTGKKIAKTDAFPLGVEPRGWPTGVADSGIYSR
jgi:hypothetical protein